MEISEAVKIIRPICRNAFAVEFQSMPCGPCEIHCSSIQAGDRRSFNDLVKGLIHPLAIINSRNEEGGGATTPAPEEKDKKRKKNNNIGNGSGGDLIVKVKLGNYCLHTKGWVDCTLYFED